MKPDRSTIDEMWRDFMAAAAMARRGDDWRSYRDSNAMNGWLESSDPQLHNEAVQAAINAELASNRFPAFLV